jgi:biopolymer transport protein ExbB/TolQ
MSPINLLVLQSQPPTTLFEMVVGGTLPTRVVLGLLAIASLFSWWLIFAKSRQFRLVRRQGDQFLERMERAQRLEDRG